MPWRDVADVAGEAEPGIDGVETSHHSVAYNLGDDRCRGDGGASLIAVNHRHMLRSVGAKPKSVDQADVRGRRQLLETTPQRGEIRPVQTGTIDLGGRDDPNADPRRKCQDMAVEVLSLLERELLGVVQPPQPGRDTTTELLVVEQDASSD